MLRTGESADVAGEDGSRRFCAPGCEHHDTHTRTHKRTHTHTYAHIRTHKRTHIRTHTHTYARIRTHTHTYTHSLTRARAHTHTGLTHTPSGAVVGSVKQADAVRPRPAHPSLLTTSHTHTDLPSTTAASDRPYALWGCAEHVMNVL